MPDESGFQLGLGAAERYEQAVAPIMAPFVNALLDAAAVAPGQSVLDLACGTGFLARAAAGRVGRAGRVVGVDINSAMLAVARHSSATTVPSIDWREASAEKVDLPEGAFDAVVCQQGMQFFPNRQQAAHEMARLVRPGGRVGVTVWSPAERSPYFAAQAEAIQSLLGPGAIGTFAAAFGCTADQVGTVFDAAGLTDIQSSEVVADIALESIDDFVPRHLRALPWGTALEQKAGLATASRLILDRLSAFISGTTLRAPFTTTLVLATRPAQSG